MQPTTEPGRWSTAALWSVAFVVVLWVQEVLDALSGNLLDSYGIVPRDDEGLAGVVFAPLLHGGWGHLQANTLPSLVLGFLVLLSGLGRGLAATAIIWVVSGLGVWLLSPPLSITLGASGLIFGWLVYVIMRGVFTRRAGEILVGAVIFILYGGLLLGVLPGQPGVSWQGHLFGAIGGGLAAWLLGRQRAAYPAIA